MPLFLRARRRRRGAVISALLVSAGLLTGLLTGPAAPAARAVVGGSPAEPPPWLAAVGTSAFLVRPSGQFCGGVLIAPDRVLTAAHCVDFLRAVPTLLSVIFGRADLSKKDGESVPVKRVWVHPDFHETLFKGETVEHNDVAVLTLARPVNRIALPVAGPGTPYPQGASATVYGWGTTSERDLLNARLRQATVPVVSDARCTEAYGRGSFDRRGMVCAGSPQADTCQFDSGGPLLLQGRLVGLTSWAYGCARPGYPGVYTRLSSYTLPR